MKRFIYKKIFATLLLTPFSKKGFISTSLDDWFVKKATVLQQLQNKKIVVWKHDRFLNAADTDG